MAGSWSHEVAESQRITQASRLVGGGVALRGQHANACECDKTMVAWRPPGVQSRQAWRGWRGAAGEAQLARRAGATGAEGRGQHLRSCREIGEGPAVENSLSFRTHGRWSALRANGAVTKKPQE